MAHGGIQPVTGLLAPSDAGFLIVALEVTNGHCRRNVVGPTGGRFKQGMLTRSIRGCNVRTSFRDHGQRVSRYWTATEAWDVHARSEGRRARLVHVSYQNKTSQVNAHEAYMLSFSLPPLTPLRGPQPCARWSCGEGEAACLPPHLQS